MADDKIEQQVTVSESAQTGDITLIGKIVNVYNTIVQQPAIWQDAIWKFLTQNSSFLLVWFLAVVLLMVLYSRFKNLYLIPVGRPAFAALLFSAAAWGAYTWFRYKHSRWNASVAVAATLAFGGLIGWQGWQIAFPEQFEPQVFGIVVAELGEGARLQPTDRTREISHQVYEHLCAAIQNEFSSDGNTDPCKTLDQTSEGNIEVKRIGVIPDSRTALQYGDQIQADVVIWGQVLGSTGKGATIRFQVLETFDRAVNPEFPIVLPVETQYTEIFIEELDLESDPKQLKDIIAEQSAVISFFTLGLVAYMDRDFPQAVNDFEKAAQTAESPALVISPEGKSLLYFYLGRSNHAIGRFHEGQEWLQRAQEANPDEPAVAIGLAIGYGGEGLEEEKEIQLYAALDMINAWLETRPTDKVAIYDRGLIYQILKQYENAIFDYQSIIERDPDYYVAYITLGQAASELGEYQLAEKSFQDAIALAERSGANPAWAYLNLALVYEKEGNLPSTKAAFQQAIKNSPATDTMYLSYARFLENQVEIDGALLNYRKLLEVTKDQGWGYSNVAGFFRRQGLLDEALDNYKYAVHYKPKDSLLRTNLAEVYFSLGDTENAKRELETAISGEASYYSYAIYGGVLFQLGEFQRSVQMYQESLKRRPADYAVLLNLGSAYEMSGEPAKAIEVYRQIISMSDQFPENVVHEAEARINAIRDGAQ